MEVVVHTPGSGVMFIPFPGFKEELVSIGRGIQPTLSLPVPRRKLSDEDRAKIASIVATIARLNAERSEEERRASEAARDAIPVERRQEVNRVHRLKLFLHDSVPRWSEDEIDEARKALEWLKEQDLHDVSRDIVGEMLASVASN